MGRRKTKIEPEKTTIETTAPTFKINLKKPKTNFPDVNSQGSDFLKMKVGDYFYKGRAKSTIFQVTDITRESASTDMLDYWSGRLYDNKDKEIIQDYKKFGNFGACKIHYKTVIRGDKAVKNIRKSKLSYWELSLHSQVNWSGRASVITFENLMRDGDYMETRAIGDVNRATLKLDAAKKRKAAFYSLKAQTPIEITDAENKVIDTLDPQKLLV